MFVLMTLGFVGCNLPLLWKLPSAWHDRRQPALDGQRDTDLWIWVLGAALSVGIGLRFFGHYYLQLVPPLALLAAGALGAQQSSRGHCDDRGRVGARGRVLGCRVLHPSVRARAEVRVGEPLRRGERAPRRPDLRVGQRAGDLLGVEPAPGHAVPHTPTFLTGNYPGRPADEVDTDADTEQDWDYFYDDFAEHPPRYLLDTSPSTCAARHPISSFPRLAKIVAEQYRYERTIDGVAIYLRK